MGNATPDWEDELERWLKPFLDRLGHKARRRMCPLYIAGLIGPGERKSIQPIAERLAAGDYDQLHHFMHGAQFVTGTKSDLLREVLRQLPVPGSREDFVHRVSGTVGGHGHTLQLPKPTAL
jgi:SRSO17 transposase